MAASKTDAAGGAMSAETPMGTLPGSSPSNDRVLDAKFCKATRADGQPCQAIARYGSDLCFWHDPAAREEMLETSRKGAAGARQRRVVIGAGKVRLKDADEIRRLLATAVNGLKTGDMAPATANALCRLLKTSLEVIQFADLSRRLAALEAGKDAK
jgi:hypothetical protein